MSSIEFLNDKDSSESATMTPKSSCSWSIKRKEQDDAAFNSMIIIVS